MASKVPIKLYGGRDKKQSSDDTSHVLSSLVAIVDDVKKEVSTDYDVTKIPVRRYNYKRKRNKKSMPSYNTQSDSKKIKQLWLGVTFVMVVILCVWFFVLYKSSFFTLESSVKDSFMIKDGDVVGESIKDSYDELTRSMDVLRKQFEVDVVDTATGESDPDLQVELNEDVTPKMPASDNISDVVEPVSTENILLPKEGLIIR